MAVNLDQGYTGVIIDAARAVGILRNQLAYMLATAQWETAQTMLPVREAYWLSEDWREANLNYYPWYGRGFVQLTWEENYQRADNELHLKGALAADAELALEPTIAGMVMIIGMSQGWFTGKKLSDYIDLEHSDFINARRIINGTDCATDIAEIAADFDAALLVEGYGVDDWEPQPAPVPSPLRSYEEQVARLDALEAWAITQGYVRG